jgi:hypothetical protein
VDAVCAEEEPLMVATTPTSKRRPFPYDLYLGDVRCMLEPQADGNLVTKKTRTLDATAPVDYTYSSANPYKERAFEWRELYGGFGQGTAPSGGLSIQIPRRYSYAQYADLSIDGLWMKGPKFETHVETVNVAAGEIRQLISALHGGTLTWFAICENAVYRRVSDGVWTVSLSAATLAGSKPQQAFRFKHRGVTPVDALYLATSASNLYKYDGAAWTLAGAAAGPGTGAVQGEARYIERVNDELWVAGDYWVVKVTDDPMVRANYSAVIYVGDQTAKITWLKQLGDTLIIWKEDGVYTVDVAGLDHELFPTLRGKNALTNGRNATVWIDRAWFTYGDQTFTMTEDGVLKPDGMEQMLENESTVKGQWIAGAGHNTWFLYELLYNVDNDMTYLMKHGTWVEENANQNTPGIAQFAEAHHGAIYEWDKRATCAEIVVGLQATGNDRLYIGFVDGTVQWCILPQNSPNPAEDPHTEFTSLTSYIYLPTHHSGFRADNKLWHAITAMGPRLTTTEWIEVEYVLDTSNDLADWVPVFPDDPKFTLPSQRRAFTADEVADPKSSKLMNLRVKLEKDPSLSLSPANLSPLIEGIVIHESIRPAFSREFTFSIKAGTFLARRNGMVDRRRGASLKDEILQRCAQVGPINVLMPTGELEALTIIDYSDSAASWAKRRDHEWLIVIQGIQLGILSDITQIISSGLTYRTLEQYTVGQLESII